MRQSDPKADRKTNGHAVRSSETRAKMIEAAIEVFATVGYEAASTRTLAERAGVNLAAIPYHFGGKRELYLAAAQAIADHARERLAPIVTRLRDLNAADPLTRIDEAISNFFRLLAGGTEPQAWFSFFIRCEHDADDAFRIIYDESFAFFERALKQAVAEVIDCDVTDDILRMRVAVVLSSVISFRALRNTTLSILGWDQLNPSRLKQLDMIIRELARSEFFCCPTRPPRRQAKRRSSTSKGDVSQESRRISVRRNHPKERTNVKAKPRP